MTNFVWTVRVGTTGKGAATAFARKHSFQVGAPVQFDEEYDRITALEYVLGAVGADVVNGLQALCRRRRVEVANVEAVVTGRLNNPLTHLAVVGEEGHPGLERVDVRVYVSSVEPEERVRQVWDETLDRSPLVRTLQPALDLELVMKVVI